MALAVSFAFATFAIASGALVESPAEWTQFRLRGSNNAVLGGTLRASWHIATRGGFSSSPTLVNGTLYTGNNAGELFAIDPASGKVKWTYKVMNPLMSAPLVYRDLVILGEGNENSPGGASPSHPIRVGAPPNALFALDARTGALVWRKALPGSGMPTPAIIKGTLVHHNGYGSIIGVDPISGRTLYERNLHSIASMAAAVPLGGDVFATAGLDTNAVWALHSTDGSTLWRSGFSRVASGLGDCPAATDGARIYCDYVMPPSSAVPVQTERQAHFRAFCIDARTGKKLWDERLEAGILPKRNEAAIPLFYDGAVFLGSSMAPVMHALDASTGKIRWRLRTRGPVKGGIAEVSGILYFGDLSGYLWAVRATNGQIVGVKNMRTPFNVGSPLVAGQTLFIGSRGGTLEAVPLEAIRSAHDR